MKAFESREGKHDAHGHSASRGCQQDPNPRLGYHHPCSFTTQKGFIQGSRFWVKHFVQRRQKVIFDKFLKRPNYRSYKKKRAFRNSDVTDLDASMAPRRGRVLPRQKRVRFWSKYISAKQDYAQTASNVKNGDIVFPPTPVSSSILGLR